MRKIIAVLGLFGVLSVGFTPAGNARPGAEEKVVAIVNARILTVTKGEIAKGSVLIANGKILEVGADVNV
ncbi:MAG: hypothetical protein MUQ25_17005, partial [Candidatus Aminicenantes bacterium]|nr:hypothetical protein [Candidatus Aminicenantes bacterium]